VAVEEHDTQKTEGTVEKHDERAEGTVEEHCERAEGTVEEHSERAEVAGKEQSKEELKGQWGGIHKQSDWGRKEEEDNGRNKTLGAKTVEGA